MRKRKESRNRRIVVLVEEGTLTLKAIGRMYDLTRERVRQIAEERGVHRATIAKIKREGLRERVVDLYNRVKNMAEVSRRLNLEYSLVISLLEGADVEIVRGVARNEYTIAELDKVYSILLSDGDLKTAARAIGRTYKALASKVGRLTRQEPEKWGIDKVGAALRHYLAEFRRDYWRQHRQEKREIQERFMQRRKYALLGLYIAHRLTEEGIISVSRLAKLTGVSGSAAYSYVIGFYAPTGERLHKLKTALNETGDNIEKIIEMCRQNVDYLATIKDYIQPFEVLKEAGIRLGRNGKPSNA